MKILVAYSSLTGNTEKVAQAIAAAVGADIKKVGEAGDCAGYDLLLYGFWVDRSSADKASCDFLSGLHGKRIVLFGTLGAPAVPPYSEKCYANAAASVPEDNELLPEHFLCQGKIDPKIIEMFKKLPADHHHAMTKESMAMFMAAAKHPDEADLDAAASFAKNLVAGLK